MSSFVSIVDQRPGTFCLNILSSKSPIKTVFFLHSNTSKQSTNTKQQIEAKILLSHQLIESVKKYCECGREFILHSSLSLFLFSFFEIGKFFEVHLLEISCDKINKTTSCKKKTKSNDDGPFVES